MSAILFGFLAALANASQALSSKGLTARAPARQRIGVLHLGNALILSARPARAVVAAGIVVAGVVLIRAA